MISQTTKFRAKMLAAAAAVVTLSSGVAEAAVSCVAAAAEPDGALVEGARAEATREASHLACGDAIGVCSAQFTALRLADGVFPGPWPGAYCQVEAVTASAGRSAGSLRVGAQTACDLSACAAAYRSFRASDCSFQPFQGPRKRCAK